MPWKNQNTATQYPMIYNHITQEEYQRIASQNKVLRGVDVPYIIVKHTLQRLQLSREILF